MNSPQQASAFSGALTRSIGTCHAVRLLPYVDFSRWLDRELDKLVSNGRPMRRPGRETRGAD